MPQYRPDNFDNESRNWDDEEDAEDDDDDVPDLGLSEDQLQSQVTHKLRHPHAHPSDPYYNPPVDLSPIRDRVIVNRERRQLTDEELARHARQRAVGTWRREAHGIRDKWGNLLYPERALPTSGIWLDSPPTFYYSYSPPSSLADAGTLETHAVPSFEGLSQVRSLDSEVAALSYRAQMLFGRELSPHEWGELVGAPDGARVEVRALPDGVLIQAQPESPVPVFLMLIRRADLGDAFLVYSRPAAHLIDMTVRENQQRFDEFAPSMLFHAARKCHQLGIEAVLCEAEGTPDTPTITGYEFWPRLGFNARILPHFEDDWAKIPPAFRDAQTVLDLYALEGGADVWELGGSGRNMVFETKLWSQSQNVLSAYLSNSLLAPGSSQQAENHGLTREDRSWMKNQISNGDMTTPLFHPFTQEFLREGGANDVEARSRRQENNDWIAQLLARSS